MKTHWIDRLTAPIAPAWTFKRQKARLALSMLQRHFEAAATGRRTQGWNKSGADANAAIGPALQSLRETARDLVRNNPYAESALGIIANHAVGYGIQAKPSPVNAEATAAWKAWAETTACDADGRLDFYGLQDLVVRTVAESGEVLVRKRIRFLDANGDPEGGLPLPLQLQVLDPDFLDTAKDSTSLLPNGGRIIQGVEFNQIGQRVAYWLFRDHPGSMFGTANQSVRVPAESVLHIFPVKRPGQVRGPSWFAPTLIRFKDFDEFEDATLMKAKVAALLAVITSDVDGTNMPLGQGDPTETIDTIEPGAILNVSPGRTVEVVQPPSTADYPEYTKTVLRAIATGLGVTYEDLTGDYADMNFSASRSSHMKHWDRVNGWRWKMLIPQFCDPVWGWAMQSAVIMRQVRGTAPKAEWTPPPAPMVDPVNEGLAYQRNIRMGIMTLSEAIRERGYDPRTLLQEMAADNKLLDELGLVLDSDGRKMTQAGQMQGAAKADDPASVADATAARDAVVHAFGLRRA